MENNSPHSFPGTRWSLVGRAGSGDAAAQPAAIGEIIRLYAPALRAHLIQSMRIDEHRADDLVQGFLADKVLEQRLVGLADPKRGRFRTFLLTALERFIIDEHRHDSAVKRAPKGEVFDVDDQRDSLVAERVREPSDAFDLVWAREVLGEVIERLRLECERSQRPNLWAVFDARYLRPRPRTSSPSPRFARSAAQARIPQQAANLLITAKRMFTRIFKAVVSRYAANENEVRQEIRDLWTIFSRRRA